MFYLIIVYVFVLGYDLIFMWYDIILLDKK